MSKPRLQCRIRYVKNWLDKGEYYVFENKWTNEPDTEWGLDTAYQLVDDRISYQALTKIRDLMRLGIEVIWGRGEE